MERALFEFVLEGGANNIAFHRAVMRNPRFVRGDLDTHFIEHETGLLDDMRTLVAWERPLSERMTGRDHERVKKAAAAAAVAAARMLYSD